MSADMAFCILFMFVCTLMLAFTFVLTVASIFVCMFVFAFVFVCTHIRIFTYVYRYNYTSVFSVIHVYIHPPASASPGKRRVKPVLPNCR